MIAPDRIKLTYEQRIFIRERKKKLIEQGKITTKGMLFAINVPVHTFDAFIHGAHSISIETCDKICDYLGINRIKPNIRTMYTPSKFDIVMSAKAFLKGVEDKALKLKLEQEYYVDVDAATYMLNNCKSVQECNDYLNEKYKDCKQHTIDSKII